jgi:hypothetical protein
MHKDPYLQYHYYLNSTPMLECSQFLLYRTIAKKVQYYFNNYYEYRTTSLQHKFAATSSLRLSKRRNMHTVHVHAAPRAREVEELKYYCTTLVYSKYLKGTVYFKSVQIQGHHVIIEGDEPNTVRIVELQPATMMSGKVNRRKCDTSEFLIFSQFPKRTF